ncbi:hypothetical protein QOZ80_5AG0391090 [Eleusine coracana subsp. coracana]|nr:hypothetical protein QOZ80_5AG0391090 [Eleusine coracana subsp. coracana]
MAATAPRKLAFASDAAREALGFGSPGDDDGVPDLVYKMLGELLRFVFSALQALLGALQHGAAALAQWARAAALPAAMVIAVLVFLCCCCGCCRQRRRGPDGEEVVTADCGGDGPVVRYRRGGGGFFSMHPNKPIK